MRYNNTRGEAKTIVTRTDSIRWQIRRLLRFDEQSDKRVLADRLTGTSARVTAECRTSHGYCYCRRALDPEATQRSSIGQLAPPTLVFMIATTTTRHRRATHTAAGVDLTAVLLTDRRHEIEPVMHGMFGLAVILCTREISHLSAFRSRLTLIDDRGRYFRFCRNRK